MASPRIVSLVPSATEMVCALGLEDQLVGVSHECDYPSFVAALPKITRSLLSPAASSGAIDRQVRNQRQSGLALYSLDVPLLASLKPDLIVTQTLCSVCAVAEGEVTPALESLDHQARLITLHPERLADIFTSLHEVAAAAGVEHRAASVVATLRETVEEVQQRSKAAISQPPRVALLEWLYPPFSSGHWNPELVRLAGGIEGLGREGQPSRTLTWDEVVAWQPEIIFIACCGYDTERTLRDVANVVASVPQWRDLPAVCAGRVYVADGSQYFNRPGPRLIDSLEILAHAIAPDVHPAPANAASAIQVTGDIGRKQAMGKPISAALLSVVGLLLGVVASSLGCNSSSLPKGAEDRQIAEPVLKTYADQTGCLFTEPEVAPLESIAAESITVPEFPGRWAIWGSTGRDNRGHLWFGVSANGGDPPSAHLYEYDPEKRQMTDRGNVVEALRRAGALQVGESQMKIHSRIVQGGDGHLYFSSHDEQGEATDGSHLPTWGGHMWRLRLPENRWEHLFATPEALIAVAGAGRWIYALGYFNHVLYQYDCATGKHQAVTVGSLGGHISRNFFCDLRGHVYVPRLQGGAAGLPATTYLVQFDTELKEQAATRFEFYSQTPNESSHGITGVQPLADGTIVFTTDQGFLFRVKPLDFLPSKVEPLGWFHPEGKNYVASLFTDDGKSHVMGYCYRAGPDGYHHEWLVFDLESRSSKAIPFSLPDAGGQAISNPALYGSITRDNQGACYLVGLHQWNVPIIFRIRRL